MIKRSKEHTSKHIKKSKSEIDPVAYQQMFQIGKDLIAEPDIDKLLNLAVDQVIEISGAERGMIILFDQTKEILFEAARKINKQDIEKPKFEISRTIIGNVQVTGKPICLKNAYEDPNLKTSKSVVRLKILSVICCPLMYMKKIFGVLYLDNRSLAGVFKPDKILFVKEFADFISLAAHRTLECKQLDSRIQELEHELRTQYDFEAIIGHSPKMIAILQTISQIADTDVTVLIEGETGTGKELVARSIHFNSLRKNKPLINMNCGAIPENLLESELFGYEKGAFTGAYKSHKGKFEQADGGTIFLDEVDEMSPALQVKVLRILQWGEFTPLGSDQSRQCDVRIVAASKVKLSDLIQKGTFRDDLYYRLNLIRIEMPPLRERPEDIPELARYFIAQAGKRYSKNVKDLSSEAQEVLKNYPFPGNVRELENIMSRSVLLCNEMTIKEKHLPPEILSDPSSHIHNNIDASIPFQEAKQRIIEDFERRYLQCVLNESGGIIRKAARIAGIHEKNFHSKLVKYGLRKKSS